jgi:ribonuclease D
VARELAAWRERTAAEEDRPVTAVVGDAQVVELARRAPRERRELREIRGLYPRTVQRRGDEILAAVARGREGAPIELEDGRRTLGSDGPPLIALAEALVRARALEAGVAYELIASRAELADIVDAVRSGKEPPVVRTLGGWRGELVGADLIGLLAGERSLSVGEKGRLEVEAPGAPPS